MPPRPKFTKEDITNVAMEIVEKKGLDALTARELGAGLGSSPRPVFTVFKDMDEVKNEVIILAKKCFDSYMEVATEYYPAYKKRGMQWIKFAQEKPMLFRMLFMRENRKSMDFDDMMDHIPFGKEQDINIIINDYHATKEQAEHLFKQMWIYTYGVCTLCATGLCRFDDDTIAQQLSEIFIGMIYVLKNGSGEVTSKQPVDKDSELSEKMRKAYPGLDKK